MARVNKVRVFGDSESLSDPSEYSIEVFLTGLPVLQVAALSICIEELSRTHVKEYNELPRSK